MICPALLSFNGFERRSGRVFDRQLPYNHEATFQIDGSLTFIALFRQVEILHSQPLRMTMESALLLNDHLIIPLK